MAKLEAGIQELISKVDEYARTNDGRRTVVVKEDLVKSIRNTYASSPTKKTEEILLNLISHYINQIEGEWS